MDKPFDTAKHCTEQLLNSERAVEELTALLPHADKAHAKVIKLMIEAHNTAQPALRKLAATATAIDQHSASLSR
jgi:hypothetical protein